MGLCKAFCKGSIIWVLGSWGECEAAMSSTRDSGNRAKSGLLEWVFGFGVSGFRV